MNSPKSPLSPRYKNLKLKRYSSPKELKEKIRQDIRTKMKRSRDLILSGYRSDTFESEIIKRISEVYNKHVLLNDDEESEMLEEIQNELIQEELEWWQKEYEKSHHDIDWSTLHQEENVICPICEKTNFDIVKSNVHCPNCKITIETDKSLLETKKAIFDAVEKHSSCPTKAGFATVTELSNTHIYLICDSCSDMEIVI
ncbi:uncharacterized protein Ripalpha [Epargyreus clarus]|uniref:uncharacterized protein Ripalpha n=1 Tax=Epargyreus clarus TaxID=520877 RepID=UPI003C2C1A2D